MAKVAKLKWDSKAYSGVYSDKKTSNEALITYTRSGLVLKVRDAINAVFVVDPQVIRTFGWPTNLFELGNCYTNTPRFTASGTQISRFSMFKFHQSGGDIVGMTWEMEKKKSAVRFDKDASTRPSPLLTLPNEIRDNIMGLVFRSEKNYCHLVSNGNKLEYNTLNDTDKKVPVNSVQNVCRQLREEYRGRDLLYNKILARDYTFRRQLSLQDRLLEGNMREVQI
jgi:hypothetical protein